MRTAQDIRQGVFPILQARAEQQSIALKEERQKRADDALVGIDAYMYNIDKWTYDAGTKSCSCVLPLETYGVMSAESCVIGMIKNSLEDRGFIVSDRNKCYLSVKVKHDF